MHLAGVGRFGPTLLCALAVAASLPLRALPGDADNSQDYPGFPRQPGFIITDYSEDNPAEADFPISRPLPLDANHVESVHVSGHRFVIRYQLAGGNPPTVYQTQLYYEKLASSGGYLVAKSGAVGDVTETFCRVMADHDIWVYVEPCNDVNVITVVEAPRGSTPMPTADQTPPQPTAPAAPPASLPAVTIPVTHTPPLNRSVTVPISPAVPPPRDQKVTEVASTPAPAPKPAAKPKPAPPPQPAPIPQVAPPVAPAVEDADGEALYQSLIAQGRVVAPFEFGPGKGSLDPSQEGLINRIVAMMKRHADLFLRVEGHTDNTGDSDDNMRLSAERAIAIQQRIIDAGIDKKRVDSVGVGGLQPIADNSTAEGRAKNRRIELVVWKRYSHRETPVPSSGDQG